MAGSLISTLGKHRTIKGKNFIISSLFFKISIYRGFLKFDTKYFEVGRLPQGTASW